MNQASTKNALRGKREVKNARNCSRSSADKEQTRCESPVWLQKVALEKYQEKIFEDFKELEEQKTKEALELLGPQSQVGTIGK